MPGTVDDFIQRFSGQQSMDDEQASRYIDRFASNAPEDSDYDNHALASGATEYLGKLPDNQFQHAAENAYATAAPQQQKGLMSTLLGALQSRGTNLAGLGSLGALFGQSGRAPAQVDPAQYAQLANYARQQHPEVINDVVRENPWFIKAMGNPVVMGALGLVASRMIKNRTQTTRQPAHQGNAGGLLGKLF